MTVGWAICLASSRLIMAGEAWTSVTPNSITIV